MDPETPSTPRHPVESIVSDYAESVRGGQRRTIDSVAKSNPEHEAALRELLPVIQKLEEARQSHIQRPSGLATLGASRPERLGDFQLIRQIGRGGMGVVFEAVQKSLGRRVALKVLPSSLLSGSEQLRRFEQEARTAAALHHTNIVPVFGVGKDQGFHYFVMQRIDGHGLDALLLESETRLTPKQVAKLGMQAASALAYAHQQHVLHRDIKPANLLVNDELDLWVTDFGVAKALEADAVTRTGDVVGTLRYMAPEQVLGEADARSDIYSLGITLYELLAGRPAIDDSSIRQAIVTRRPAPSPPPLRQLNPDVPLDLETILQTAMSNEPAARYQTADAFKQDLSAFLDGRPIAVRRMTWHERVTRWARQNPAVASLSALSLILLASVAILSSAGLIQLRAAFEREKENRQKAEQIAEVAVGAVDQIFQRFAGTTESTEPEKEFAASPAISLETAEMLEDLLPFYGQINELSFADSGITPELQQSTAGAQAALAEIHFSLGHYQRAIDTYRGTLLKQPDEGIDSRQQRLQAAKLHNRLGLCYRMLGDDQTAEQEHQLAMDLLGIVDEVAETGYTPDAMTIRFEKARTHYLLALYVLPGMGPTAMPTVDLLHTSRLDNRDVFPGMLQPRGAPPRSNRPPPRLNGQGLPPSQRDANRPPPPRRGRDQRLRTDRRNAAHAEDLDLAITILRELLKQDPQNLSYSLSLARSLRQHEHDETFHARSATKPTIRESVELLRELKGQYPDNETVLFELSEALADQQLYNADSNSTGDSIAQLTEAADTFTHLCDVHPNVPKYINAMVHTHFKQAMLMERESQTVPQQQSRELQRQASDSLRRAVDGYAAQVQMHPNAAGYRAWYALFLYHYGRNALVSGLYEQSVVSLDEAADQWNLLIKSNPDERISWRALPDVYRHLGEAFQAIGNETSAKEAFDLAAISQEYLDLGP
jgi:tetratricopeptide (TPR) repeat protein